jgi:hypothetical protein
MARAVGLREFLRGAYKDINDITVVTRHGHPIGTWIPHGMGGERAVIGERERQRSPAPENVESQFRESSSR